MKAYTGSRGRAKLLTSALEGCQWCSCPGHFNPGNKPWYPLHRRQDVSDTSRQQTDCLYRCTVKYRKAACTDFLMMNTYSKHAEDNIIELNR